MGRSYTPKYVVDVNTVDGVPVQKMAWNDKYCGKPSVANLEKWVETFNASIDKGGCNDHLPQGAKVVSAKILLNRTGEVVYETVCV